MWITKIIGAVSEKGNNKMILNYNKLHILEWICTYIQSMIPRLPDNYKYIQLPIQVLDTSA